MQNSNYSKCNREAKDIMLYSLAGHCQVQCSVIQCSAEASEVQCGAMQNTKDTASYKQDFTKTWIGSRNLSELSSPSINREAKKSMVCTV